jgi:hypothetical protein
MLIRVLALFFDSKAHSFGVSSFFGLATVVGFFSARVHEAEQSVGRREQ